MNFAPYQWALSFYLDFFLKSVFVSFFGLLVTLGGAPVFGFVVLAFFLSLFNLVCLFLGWTFVCLLELVGVKLAQRARFFVTLLSANVLFVVSIAALGSGHDRPDQTFSDFGDQLIVSSVLAVTNVIPILLAAACGRIFSRS